MDSFSMVKMGGRGRVVIPMAQRQGFQKGEKLVVLRRGDKVVYMRAGDAQASLQARLKSLDKVSAHSAAKMKPAATKPVKMPKRDKFGHFLPAKKAKK